MNRKFLGRIALIKVIVLVLTAVLTLTALAATLDPTFGDNGVAWWEQGNFFQVLMQGEKIVARDGDSISGKKLARFNGDGSLDRTFGTDGEVLVKHRVYDFTIQPDGKIVAAGSMKIDRERYLVVTRYNRNGTPDETFGEGGTVITVVRLYDNFFNDVVIQPDGKILAGGGSGQQLISSWEGYPVLVRYLPDGTPDKSFGDMGVAILDSTWMQTVRHIGLQYDDRIIISGYTRQYSYTTEPQEVVIARHHFDGRLDRSFGDNGLKKIGEGHLDDMLLQPDEKIVLLGSFEGSGAGLARFHGDGTFDEGFGEGGIVRVPPQYYGASTRGMVMQKDGRILLTGYTVRRDHYEDYSYEDYYMKLVRFNPDGSFDGSFGDNGDGSVAFKTYDTSWQDMANDVILPQADKILVAGTSDFRAVLVQLDNVAGSALPATTTPSPTPTPSPSPTATPSPTPSATSTLTPSATPTPTNTPTLEEPSSSGNAPAATPTTTSTPTPENTPTPAAASETTGAPVPSPTTEPTVKPLPAQRASEKEQLYLPTIWD